MKILIDARMYGLEHAGIGRYVTNLIKHIPQVDKKNEYSLLLREKYMQSKEIPESYGRILADFRHYSVKEQLVLPKVINSYSFDLVHFPHFNAPVRIKLPFVVTIHDLLMHRQKSLAATTLNPLFYTLKRIGYYKVFNHVVKESKRILVPSNVVKNELIHAYPESSAKIKVTYEGLDENIKKLKSLEVKDVLTSYKIDQPYYIYAGSAYPHKNLSRAIEATVFLNKNLSLKGKQKVRLVLVTSRPVFTSRLQEMVKKFNAQNDVKLLGYVDDRELSALYQGAVGFLYPSLSEGFGLPGLEAMSVGTIALVSDIPIFKEIYKDAAYYFNPFDFSSIQKAMLEVYGMKPKKKEVFSKNGKKLLEKYSWKKMAQETVNIYEKAI